MRLDRFDCKRDQSVFDVGREDSGLAAGRLAEGADAGFMRSLHMNDGDGKTVTQHQRREVSAQPLP